MLDAHLISRRDYQVIIMEKLYVREIGGRLILYTVSHFRKKEMHSIANDS